MHHRAALRQEHMLDRPIEAAGAAQPGHVPAARHDLDLGAREKSAPVEWPSLGAEARLAVVKDLEAAEHPARFRRAAAELPAPRHAGAALDRGRPAAAPARTEGRR